MYPFLTNLINFAVLIIIAYCIYKTEKDGTPNEKEINRHALASTVTFFVWLGIFKLFFQLLTSFLVFIGVFAEKATSSSDLSISAFFFLFVYIYNYSYYRKPEEERAKLLESIKFYEKK